MENQITPEKHVRVARPHRPSRILFIPFFIFFVGIAILLGRYFFHQTVKIVPGQKTTISTLLTPQPTSPQSTTGSLAAPGQKQYQNTTDKFTFQYPSSLVLKESPYGLGVDSLTLTDPTVSVNPRLQIIVFPKLIGATIGQSFDTYFGMQNGQSTVVQAPNQPSQQVTKVQNSTINGLPMVEVTTTDSPAKPNEIPNIGRYIELGNNELVIVTSPDNQALMNQVLSTLSYPN